MTRQLAILHFALCIIIISLDIFRSEYLASIVFEQNGYFYVVYLGMNGFYMVIMVAASVFFFRGVYIVRSRMLIASKSVISKSGGGTGTSAVDEFLTRMSRLTILIGTALIIGGIAFLMYSKSYTYHIISFVCEGCDD